MDEQITFSVEGECGDGPVVAQCSADQAERVFLFFELDHFPLTVIPNVERIGGGRHPHRLRYSLQADG